MSLLRVGEGLDLVQRCLVQVNVLPERGHIARLLADDLRGCVLHDAGAVLIGLGRACPQNLQVSG